MNHKKRRQQARLKKIKTYRDILDYLKLNTVFSYLTNQNFVTVGKLRIKKGKSVRFVINNKLKCEITLKRIKSEE